MPNAPHAEGLLGQGIVTSHGEHLYHADKPPVVVYTAKQKADALSDGYSEEYIPCEYPKVVHEEAADAAAFKDLSKRGFSPAEPSATEYPRVMSKTFTCAENVAIPAGSMIVPENPEVSE